MNKQPRKIWPALLLSSVLIAALGGLASAAWEVWSNNIDTSAASIPKPSSTIDIVSLAAAPVAFKPSPLSQFSQTAQRPLFSETRRQPKPKPVKVNVVNTPPPPPHIPFEQLQLTGVILNGSTARALIISPSAPEGDWHGVEDTVGGWKIIEIQGNFARMEAGKKRRDLQLYVDNK